MSMVLHGDALERLRELPDNRVNAIVTDPPAGISFMGKDWDNFSGKSARDSQPIRDAFISFMASVMTEALRVLKPGGHALVWALPRTSHWTALALEDAGFEIRDCVYHLFGSGFPKSLDVSKAIDKMAGAQREVVGSRTAHDIRRNVKKDAELGWTTRQGKFGAGAPSQTMEYEYTAPATPDAEQWDGWGTALKPAVECWWLCRKPLSEPTVAKNVLKWGTGAINVDGCRVGLNGEKQPAGSGKLESWRVLEGREDRQDWHSHATPVQGRWPANLVMSHTLFCVQRGSQLIKGNASGYNWEPSSNQDNPVKMHNTNIKSCVHYGNEEVELWECAPDCPVALLDQQSGVSRSSTPGFHGRKDGIHVYNGNSYYKSATMLQGGMEYGDTGGASRYFSRFHYSPKASRAERNRGCEELPEQPTVQFNDGMVGAIRSDGTVVKPAISQQNHHPTVKPLALMRWLIRLITPPSGVVLDPFAGSGSTLVAAKEEGFSFIGIEREDEYVSIIEARLKAVS